MTPVRANHKLGEAKHFLGEMREFDGASGLDRPEVFGYKFSAFLSAALSIEFVLPREVDRTAYKAERAAWHSSLSPHFVAWLLTAGAIAAAGSREE